MRRFVWLALVSMFGCIEPATKATGPVERPPEQPAPCADYAAGEDQADDGGCFAWAAVGCATEGTDRDGCEGAVEVGSPNGDLMCVWMDSAIAVDPDQACVEIDASPRCIPAVVTGSDSRCEGTQRWLRFEEEEGQELIVTLDCGLHPVPDFDECATETAAGVCC